MGKNRTIFFFAISKSKHSSQIKFFFLKIRVQPVASHLFFIQIQVCTFCNRSGLCIICDISHNRKYLTGQHHADMIIPFAFHRSAVIIIISVKPAISVFIRYPFLRTDQSGIPVSTLPQILHQSTDIHRNLFSRNIMHTLTHIIV